MNVFGGAGNLPLLVAEERGYFARNGLAIELVPTANSADQLRGLIDGRWQIVHTSPDNLLAGSERVNVELVAWLGARNGPLTLVSQPPIRSVAELRGRSLAVDALDTGYASSCGRSWPPTGSRTTTTVWSRSARRTCAGRRCARDGHPPRF